MGLDSTQLMKRQAASFWALFLGMAQPQPPLTPAPPGMGARATFPATLGHCLGSSSWGSIHQ